MRKEGLEASSITAKMERQRARGRQRDLYVTISSRYQQDAADDPSPARIESVHRCGRQCLK